MKNIFYLGLIFTLALALFGASCSQTGGNNSAMNMNGMNHNSMNMNGMNHNSNRMNSNMNAAR